MKIKRNEELAVGDLRTGKAKNSLTDRIKIGLGITLLAALTGCVGYVDGGYGGTAVIAGPEVGFFGGYGRGRDVRVYSHRGFESRGAAHPGGFGHGGRR